MGRSFRIVIFAARNKFRVSFHDAAAALFSPLKIRAGKAAGLSVQSQGALWGAPCVVVFAPVSSVGMSEGRNWMCSHLITRIL